MSYPTWSDLNSPSIVPPLGARQAPSIGPAALMVSTEPDLRFLSNSVGLLKSQPFFMGTLMTGKAGHGGYSIAGPYIGAPYGVMLLESLIAKGAQSIVILGWCGAISNTLVPGDLVVPDYALVDEGTSRHYMKLDKDTPRVSPDRQLSEKLADYLTSAGEKVHHPPIWTTDAIYRETPEKVEWFRNKGAHAVEMECSALFAAAAYRKVKAAALLIVSDTLATENGDWDPGFKHKRFKTMRKLAAKSAVEITRTLVQ